MKTLQEIEQEYQVLMHAVQSGVSMWMNYDSAETAPKHLRVGVNSALISASASAQLMIDKGIFTKEEYFAKMNELLRDDIARYELWLSKATGANVKLA